MSTLSSLIVAEQRARELFVECVRRELIAAGKTERELSEEVAELASTMFGVRRFWHKRIVRAGANTVLPYAENPADLVVQPDDLVFVDFGPVFADLGDDWEADFGQSFVIGTDVRKHKLVADAARAWDAGVAHFRAHPELTAAELYNFVSALARRDGWQFGHTHCGHIVGKFPHERELGDDDTLHIRADNHLPLRRVGATGEPLRWILEIHFVDRAAGVGAFQESLLLDAAA